MENAKIVNNFSDKLNQLKLLDDKEVFYRAETTIDIQKSYKLSTGDMLRKKVVIFLESMGNNKFKYSYLYSYCCPYVENNYPTYLSSRIKVGDEVKNFDDLIDWIKQDFSNNDIQKITGVKAIGV